MATRAAGTGVSVDLDSRGSWGPSQELRRPGQTREDRPHFGPWQFRYDVDMSPRHEGKEQTPLPGGVSSTTNEGSL